MSKKIIYDSTKSFEFKEDDRKASYFPEIDIDDNELLEELSKIKFTRVKYISRFGKANRTPRLTWCYGKISNNSNNSNIILPNVPLNDKVKNLPIPVSNEIVDYKGLNFIPEVMPQWLENLSFKCRQISIDNYNFDPEYNSCIIGRYDDKDDSIGFHFDTETFLTHHFCANVTLGYARDFQFKDSQKQLYEVKLQNKSLLFFSGVEHALPKRAAVKPGEIRYSISFRNMKNNIGIGNSYYYCRGLDGAIDDDDKIAYVEQLTALQQI